MSVIVNNVIRVTARMKWNATVDIQNVFTARLSSGTSIDDDDAKADLAEWVDDLYTEIVGMFPSDLTFEDLDFYNLTSEAPMGTLSWPTLTAGTGGTTEIAATGVAIVITAFTSIVRVHGRKFFGPVLEAMVDAGYFNSTALAYVASCIAVWITPFTGSTTGETWTPGIWRRVAESFAQFRDAVVRNIPGYQRRRKANVGS